MENKPRAFLFQISTLFFWFSLYAYVPNLSAYAEEMGADLTMVGLITSGYGFSQMLCRIPLGILSDRIHKRRIFIVIGFISSLAACVLFLFFEEPIMLMAARLVSGVAASTWVIFTVLYSGYFSADRSTKAMSLLNTYNHAGQMLGMLAAGVALSLFSGYKAMFIIALIGAGIGLILSLNITEKVPENTKPMTLKGFFSVVTDKRLLLLSLAALINQIYSLSTGSGFTPLLAVDLGANSFSLSVLSIVTTVLAMFGSLLSGFNFISKLGEKWVCCISCVIIAVTTVFMPLSPNLSGLYILQGIGGIARGVLFALQMGLAIRHIPAESRATAMGCFQAIYGIGMFAGPLLVGILSDHFGLSVGYYSIAAAALIVIPLTLWWANADEKAKKH